MKTPKLPQTVLNALASDEYKVRPGYSATTLIKPPQIKALQDRYGDDEQDPISRLWSVLGTAVHNVMEKNVSENACAETYITMPWKDTTIHGTIDHYEDGVISDFKVTSAWKAVRGDYSDWEQQLNIYAYLLSQEKPVHSLQIIGLFRDWSKMQATRSPDYPQAPVVTIPITLWEPEVQYEFIDQRVQAHEMAASLEDNALPECSDHDRWYTGTKYAVMKKGNKRAVKLHDNLDEATSHAAQDSKCYVEIREGEHKRCMEYCPVASKCQQWRRLRENSNM